MKAGAVLGSVMLFAFSLKFLFKLKNHKPENRIKLKEAEHPHLWNFVYQICKETGAPKPKNIYVDPDVNAYVAYSNSWLSLFLPVKKELTIGLGLVNSLNLSEFKAVVTHEFGHFAQSSMKIGSYIMSANTIIHDMIYNRDKWDELLDKWRQSDIRLSAAAWVITPIVWLIRKALSLFYQFLNIMYSSLSREMEFNADKVAISTSGSDAIVAALWKLDSGFEQWNDTLNHTYLAAQKKLFTANVYRHNQLSIERNADDQKEKLSNLQEDSRGGKQYFTASNNSKVNMYASHPPNDHRQENAKVPFVPCAADERSPWLLFNNDEALQESMTQLIYEQYFRKKPVEYATTDQFESFISLEQNGKDLLTKFENTFEKRFFNIPDKDTLASLSLTSVSDNAPSFDPLKKALSQLMDPVRQHEALINVAIQISQGTTQQKNFNYNGEEYSKKNLDQGYNEIVKTLSKLYDESFIEWDHNFIQHLFAKAKSHQEKVHLKDLLEQHRTINYVYQKISGTNNSLRAELNGLQEHEEVTELMVSSLGRKITSKIFDLNDTLAEFDSLTFKPLPNIDNLLELKLAITEDGAFKKIKGPIFENGNIDEAFRTLDIATQNCQRVDQKSIIAILQYGESLGA